MRAIASNVHSSRALRPAASIAAAFSIAAVLLSAQAGKPDPIPCTTSSSAGLRAVWDRYVDGLRRGDLSRLKSIFSDKGMFHILSSSRATDIDTLTGQTFAEALPVWVDKPDPNARGTMIEATAVQTIGVIKGRLTFGPDLYEDVLTLYCVRGRWEIVGKLTYAAPHSTKR